MDTGLPIPPTTVPALAPPRSHRPAADGIHAGVGCAASPPTGWLPPVLAASALAVVVATALTIRSLTPSQQLKKLGNYEDRAPIFDF